MVPVLSDALDAQEHKRMLRAWRAIDIEMRRDAYHAVKDRERQNGLLLAPENRQGDPSFWTNWFLHEVTHVAQIAEALTRERENVELRRVAHAAEMEEAEEWANQPNCTNP